MDNFSQNSEQQHILNYFGDFVGTFLDLGCNDCKTFSNTHALALRGWKGFLVDPSPQAMAKCKELYNGHKNFFYYEMAISKHNGKAILNESGPLCSAADVGLVSTFHPSEMERFKRTVSYTPIEVKTFRWKTFINRLTVKEFDFISLDCEGDELNILPHMDLSKTRMVCIEWNSKPELKTEYEKYLDGFTLLYTSAENLLYGRR